MNSMARHIPVFIGLSLLSSSAFFAAQKTPSRPPVIDMHTHVDVKKGPAIMESLNVRYWWLAVHNTALQDWAKLDAMANRYLPALILPCDGGREILFNRFTCYETGTEFPDITWLRGEVQSGRIKALGEIVSQYLGLAPGDSRMEPYWALAEEFDIPVGIHMGPGP